MIKYSSTEKQKNNKHNEVFLVAHAVVNIYKLYA